MEKYGFIGCGNMGGALIRAAAKAVSPKNIWITDKDAAKQDALAKETGAAVKDIKEIASKCSCIFLGVKPQVIADMLAEIKKTLAGRKDHFVLVSMAAGISIERIIKMAGDFPIIRIMPNIPASVGEGMILYCSHKTVKADVDSFLKAMSKAGKLSAIDEKLIDAGSAVSGCGPAYAFMFIEALADGGVDCGLPRAQAQLLAAQTLLGAAKMVMETGKHPGELKDAVCSPGGTTIEGVLALEQGGFRGAASEAVVAAYEKTLGL
jgi:pyrroline-5-carboxylate reductase